LVKISRNKTFLLIRASGINDMLRHAFLEEDEEETLVGYVLTVNLEPAE
jgi:hypothetical protein